MQIKRKLALLNDLLSDIHIFSNLFPTLFTVSEGQNKQLRIRIPCGLYPLSWAGFWKNDMSRCMRRKDNTYSNMLFIIYYILFIIYHSSDSPLSLITELSVTQSLSSLSSPSSSHRMSYSDQLWCIWTAVS